MKNRTPDSESFWNRNFLLALFGYFFLFMSVSLFFLLPLFLKQFSPRESQVGLIMGIHSVMAIAVRPAFGRMIDLRGGRKSSLLGILLLLATVPLFHLVKDAGSFPLILRALSGLGWGIGMTATIAVCSDLAPAESLARSMGVIGIAGLVANAAGPLLAEEIIRSLGFGWVFNFSIIFLLAAFLCVAATKDVPRPCYPSPPSGRAALRGVSVLVLLIVAAMPVVHGSIRGAMIYFSALFAEAFQIGRVGPFFALFSLAAILTRFGLADLSDRHGRKRIIFPSAVIIGLNLFLLSQVKSYPMFLLAGFIGGLGQGLIFPALSTYIIDFLGRENKGLAISLYLSLVDVGMGLGSPFYGWISDLTSYRVMYIWAGVLLLLATAVFMIKAPATVSGRRVTPSPRPDRSGARPVT